MITSRDMDIDELAPHYMLPNFVRPIPEAEEDPDFDGSYKYRADAKCIWPFDRRKRGF